MSLNGTPGPAPQFVFNTNGRILGYRNRVTQADEPMLLSEQLSALNALAPPKNATWFAGGKAGASPKVFLLGTSIEMRDSRVLSSATVTTSTTDATITLSSGGVVPGSYIRVINQTDTRLNRSVPVVASDASGVTVRYSFDVTNLFEGYPSTMTTSAVIFGQKNDTGWFNYAAGLLAIRGCMVTVINCGVGGDKTTSMLARVDSEIAPLCAPGDIVVVGSPVNDHNTLTVAQSIANLESIYNRLMYDLGLRVHACTEAPAYNSTYWSTNNGLVAATVIAEVKKINGYIRTRALSESMMRCADLDDELNDGTGYGITGTIEPQSSSGGVHAQAYGAQCMGRRYFADCGMDYPKCTFRRHLSTSDDSTWNLISNAEFTGATGSTAPTGWTATGTSNTFTLAARADGAGNDLLFAKAAGGANTSTLSIDLTSLVAAGDRLIFGSEMEGGTDANGTYLKVRLDIVIGGVTQSYRIGNNQFAYAPASGGLGRTISPGERYYIEQSSSDNGGRNGVLIPSGFTSIAFTYELNQGAAGAASVIVSRPQVKKVTG